MKDELESVLKVNRYNVLLITGLIAAGLSLVSIVWPDFLHTSIRLVALAVGATGLVIYHLVPSHIFLPKWFPTIHRK